MNQEDIATEACYYRQGIFAGAVVMTDAIAWADRIVSELYEPPLEIIDVAFAKTESEIEEKLKEVKGDPNYAMVSGLLYYVLLAELKDYPDRSPDICDRAVAVSRLNKNDEVYFRLAHVQDDFELIRLKAEGAGTMEYCSMSLIEVLNEYAVDPASTRLRVGR